MLVLSRRLGETLKIGDDIEVRILGISGNQIRLGVEASRHVAVDRAEIRERKDAGQPAPRREANVVTPTVQKRSTIVRSRLYGRVSAD